MDRAHQLVDVIAPDLLASPLPRHASVLQRRPDLSRCRSPSHPASFFAGSPST